MSFTVKWVGVAPYTTTTIKADGRGADFTLNPGVTPSTGTFYCRANFSGIFPTEGDLTLNDGSTNVVLRVRAMEGRIELTTGDRAVPVTFVDRRWKWKYGGISGTYNQPDGEGKPTSEQSAQALAQLCLEALGETIGATAFVTDVPTDVYPPVKWEYENPAKALQDVLNQAGCLIALGYDDIVRCHDLSDTSPTLPAGSYEKYDQGDKAVDRPSKIIVVGGKIVLEEEFDTFEAVGLDTDGYTKLLADLSYAPGAGGVAVASWDDVRSGFFSLWSDRDRFEAARDSIYKWFRVRFDADDTINAATALKKLPFLNFRSAVVENKNPTPGGHAYVHDKPQLKGEVYGWTGTEFTTSPITTIIRQGWNLDRKSGIIKFNQPAQVPDTDAGFSGGWKVPSLALRAAYKRNEQDGVDFYTYEYIPVWNNPAGGTYASNCDEHIVHVPELILYKIDGVAQNQTELDVWALKRAEYEKAKFDDELAPEGKIYEGIVRVSPDNGIMSVRWAIGERGATTDVQLGYDEPKSRTVTYKEKLSQVTNWLEVDKARIKRKQDDREAEDDTD